MPARPRSLGCILAVSGATVPTHVANVPARLPKGCVNMGATVKPSEPGRSDSRETRRAWWSLILMPVGFVAAFVVGEGIPAWMGYDSAITSPPWWVIALAFIAALVVFASPLLVTRRFSRRAAAANESGAWEPLIVSASLVGAFVLINLGSGLLV